MKTLLLMTSLLVTSAYSATDYKAEALVKVSKKNGDIAIAIRGAKAEELYKSLDVVPEPGLGNGKLKTSHKKGDHLKCSVATRKSSISTIFQNAVYKAKLKKYQECLFDEGTKIGSADPLALEKICGKKPEKPASNKARYSCLIKLDKQGRAYDVK